MSICATLASDTETRALGAGFARRLGPGDVVLLYGELGAGKTTFVRGYVEAMGYHKVVRSPTFNLIQIFDTNPPTVHADLYRVADYQGLGLEDFLDASVVFIEWPERAQGLLEFERAWRVKLRFAGHGREAVIVSPQGNG